MSFIDDDFDEPTTNGTIADIPKACLNFDPKAGSYEPAAEVVQKAKDAESKTGDSQNSDSQSSNSKSGAGRLQTPGVPFWALTLAGGLLLGFL